MTAIMVVAIVVIIAVAIPVVIPVAVVVIILTMMMTMTVSLLVLRHILAVIPFVLHKVDPLSTGIIPVAVSAPVSGVATGYMHVDRRAVHRCSMDGPWLSIDHLRRRVAADVDLPVEAGLADVDGHSDVGRERRNGGSSQCGCEEQMFHVGFLLRVVLLDSGVAGHGLAISPIGSHGGAGHHGRLAAGTRAVGAEAYAGRPGPSSGDRQMAGFSQKAVLNRTFHSLSLQPI